MTRTFERTAAPTSSPWGPVQGSEELAPGIWSVWTASHGGIKLSPERLEAMRPALRDIGEKSPYHERGGWFEEDAEWSAVALAFPTAFPMELQQKAALATIKRLRTAMGYMEILDEHAHAFEDIISQL